MLWCGEGPQAGPCDHVCLQLVLHTWVESLTGFPSALGQLAVLQDQLELFSGLFEKHHTL